MKLNSIKICIEGWQTENFAVPTIARANVIFVNFVLLSFFLIHPLDAKSG